MESKTKNRKTREQLAAMVNRAFDGVTLADGEDAITELKEGWFNVAYDLRLSDGRNVILKIAPPKGSDILTYEKDIMTTEVSAMRMVAQNPGIPVPQIYFFDQAHDLCDADYFFMEKLCGVNYDHVKKDMPEAVKNEIDRSIGVVVREINTFTGSYFGYEGNSDLRASTWKEAFLKIVDSVLDDGVRKNADMCFDVAVIRAAVRKHAPSLAAVTAPRLVH